MSSNFRFLYFLPLAPDLMASIDGFGAVLFPGVVSCAFQRAAL